MMTCYDSAVHRSHPALMVLRAASLLALAASMATLLEYGGVGTFCAAGGGCDEVRRATAFAEYLPRIGLLGFTALFVMTMARGRVMGMLTIGAAIAAGVGGLYFIYLQAAVIGAFCWLCLVVDASALIAAGCAVVLLAKKVPAPELGEGLLNPWWAFFWVAALAPIVIAVTFDDSTLPDAIRELHHPTAEVNIVEMADFECPYCKAMHPVLRQAIEESGADVHLVRIIVPLSFHEHARDAARAYFCAPEAQREAMADALFATVDLTRRGLAASAAEVGLDPATFASCLDDAATYARVEQDLVRAERAGMEGLPSVYIGERIMIGFDPDAGISAFLPAIAEARRGEDGPRIRYWPGVAMVVLAGASLLIGLWARRRQARQPDPDSKDPQAPRK